jgi:hypothetical protein
MEVRTALEASHAALATKLAETDSALVRPHIPSFSPQSRFALVFIVYLSLPCLPLTPCCGCGGSFLQEAEKAARSREVTFLSTELHSAQKNFNATEEATAKQTGFLVFQQHSLRAEVEAATDKLATADDTVASLLGDVAKKVQQMEEMLFALEREQEVNKALEEKVAKQKQAYAQLDTEYVAFQSRHANTMVSV